MMQFLKYSAYILTIIGAINWGLIGIFGFNLVASLLGDMTILSRILYSIIGLSAIFTTFTMHQCGDYHSNNCEYGQCNI